MVAENLLFPAAYRQRQPFLFALDHVKHTFDLCRMLSIPGSLSQVVDNKLLLIGIHRIYQQLALPTHKMI